MEFLTKFLIPRSWWDIYINPQSNSVPPIDNKELIECNSNNLSFSKIRSEVKKTEYVLVTQEEWDNIQGKFGGGPELEVFIVENEEDLSPILIDVWVIQESLLLKPTASFAVSKKITVRNLKQYLCNKLRIDENRYDFFIIKQPENIPVVKELKCSEMSCINNTKIVKYCKVCLKFEDINWDYTKNDEGEIDYCIQQSLMIQKQIWFEKIEKSKERQRYKLKLKKLKKIKKNIINLLAVSKLE